MTQCLEGNARLMNGLSVARRIDPRRPIGAISHFVMTSTSASIGVRHAPDHRRAIRLFRNTQETTMLTLTSRSLSRAAVMAALTLAGSSTLFTASVEPAMALCKKGTPHCIPYP